ALMLRRVAEIWPTTDSAAVPPSDATYAQAFTSWSKRTTYWPVATFSEDVRWLLRAADPFVATTAQSAVAAGPAGPVAPDGPAGPDAPRNAPIVLTPRSRVFSEPSITCAEPTLFRGRVVAA